MTGLILLVTAATIIIVMRDKLRPVTYNIDMLFL